MREPKFRMYDERVKRMIPNEQIYLGICKIGTHKDLKLMQYTGLKDKNGKEIYEGDILGGEYYVDGVAGEVTTREDWGGCSFLEYKGGGDDFLFRECKNAEVIGNIYENPEILDQ